MDKITKSSTTGLPGHWVLQDAKARFSELVRRVRSEGPQHVTVHGRDEVVVIAAEEFRRLRGDQSGLCLVDAMQSSPRSTTRHRASEGDLHLPKARLHSASVDPERSGPDAASRGARGSVPQAR